MNRYEYVQLLSEQTALQRMIAETDAEDVIDMGSLTSRLDQVQQKLATVEVVADDPARVRLTFNGRPVVGGTHGIFADFGMKAVNGFSEAIAAVAASLSAPLAAMGPIPNRDQNQLLITGTALGSFGFELEEHRNGMLPLEEQSAVALAIRHTQELLQSSIDNDDEMLADAATEMDDRALEKIRIFVQTLANNEAICSLQFGEHVFRFRDAGEVNRTLQRISRDNLHEEEIPMRGKFSGIIASQSSFEFIPAAGQEPIVGKIAKNLGDIAAEIKAHLDQPVNARLLVKRVGNGKPRYLLLAAEFAVES